MHEWRAMICDVSLCVSIFCFLVCNGGDSSKTTTVETSRFLYVVSIGRAPVFLSISIDAL